MGNFKKAAFAGFMGMAMMSGVSSNAEATETSSTDSVTYLAGSGCGGNGGACGGSGRPTSGSNYQPQPVRSGSGCSGYRPQQTRSGGSCNAQQPIRSGSSCSSQTGSPIYRNGPVGYLDDNRFEDRAYQPQQQQPTAAIKTSPIAQTIQITLTTLTTITKTKISTRETILMPIRDLLIAMVTLPAMEITP
jgi:hypothetical protein